MATTKKSKSKSRPARSQKATKPVKAPPAAAAAADQKSEGAITQIGHLLDASPTSMSVNAISAKLGSKYSRKAVLKAIYYLVAHTRAVKHGDGRNAAYSSAKSSSPPAAKPAAAPASAGKALKNPVAPVKVAPSEGSDVATLVRRTYDNAIEGLIAGALRSPDRNLRKLAELAQAVKQFT